MQSFEKLNKRNAKAFFDAYLARKDGVLAEMMRQYAADGHDPRELDYSPQSLVPFWVWMRVKMTSPSWDVQDAPNEQMPMWYLPLHVNDEHRPRPISKQSAELADMFAYYWGEVLRRNIPDLHWGIGDHPGSYGYCAPMVLGEYYSAIPLPAGQLAVYNANRPSEPKYAEDNYLNSFKNAVEDEAKYRALYNKLGGHDDPRMAKRVKFD